MNAFSVPVSLVQPGRRFRCMLPNCRHSFMDQFLYRVCCCLLWKKSVLERLHISPRMLFSVSLSVCSEHGSFFLSRRHRAAAARSFQSKLFIFDQYQCHSTSKEHRRFQLDGVLFYYYIPPPLFSAWIVYTRAAAQCESALNSSPLNVEQPSAESSLFPTRISTLLYNSQNV